MTHEQYCLGSAVANLTCRNCGEVFVHMQARRLHERFCANTGARGRRVLFIGFATVGSRFGCPTPNLRRDRQTAQHKQHVHHKNCRGGGLEQLKCVRCNKLFATLLAPAAHDTSCRCCRWCNRMFRSQACHKRLCPDQPNAEVVPE